MTTIPPGLSFLARDCPSWRAIFVGEFPSLRTTFLLFKHDSCCLSSPSLRTLRLTRTSTWFRFHQYRLIGRCRLRTTSISSYFINIDCIGAIDGTHVRAKVSPTDAPRFRGGKEYPTQNILAACGFDLKFTYVLAGWEGTASDSKILKNALRRSNRLIIPEGKYYLVDAGFMTKSSLLTPYRRTRYHLKEYSKKNPPRNYRELFNLRHSSARNVIERAFGVVKKRFPIMGSSNQPHYSVKVQKEIIVACCLLHNYLIEKDPDRQLIDEVDAEIASRTNEPENDVRVDDNQDRMRGEQLRDDIAAAMWRDYNVRRATER
ncbi:hypothetical protein LUZ61_013325 [Rhynchospora tenuis]|uniref:DDE Tnp4 domain-containing protein n=1 Tax=Rhynchospora tenuis TaxID=198213 RepID=A0AAD5W8H4_9POAL|nr:hypothetical protein LUZ61_013325 [Rhynchospora tenuis]